MLQDLFQPLLTIVGPTITKQSTRMIDILLADECLALTTHFLPSRNSQISLSYYSYWQIKSFNFSYRGARSSMVSF